MGARSLPVPVKTEGQAMLMIHSRSQELVSKTLDDSSILVCSGLSWLSIENPASWRSPLASSKWTFLVSLVARSENTVQFSEPQRSSVITPWSHY